MTAATHLFASSWFTHNRDYSFQSRPFLSVVLATPSLYLGFFMLLLAGCATGSGAIMSVVHGDPGVQVVVKTDPPGAKISLDGKYIGTSPITFRDPSGGQQTFTIEVQKDGYEPIARTLTRKWDSMRLTYRLDPVYYYTLFALPGSKEEIVAAAKSAKVLTPASTPPKPSDVDEIPKLRKLAKDRDAVALVIGISKYRDEMIPPVRYAKRDAETIASYLEAVGGIPRSRMKILTDEGATLSDFSAYIEEWLPRRVSADTTVFVYYAGHGAPNPTTGKAFIVPYDGHPDFSSKLYPLDRLYETLDKLPAKEVVVMLDSCFSGATGRSVLPNGARPLALTIENPALVSGKLAVLAAASGTQISSDYDKEQHGLFTYFLLKGLRGDADKDGNGVVDVGELFEYIQKRVTAVASEELNRDQTPLLMPPPELLGKRGKISIAATK